MAARLVGQPPECGTTGTAGRWVPTCSARILVLCENKIAGELPLSDEKPSPEFIFPCIASKKSNRKSAWVEQSPERGIADTAGATKEKCDGITLTNVQAECGRPLGLDFDRRHRELYITDAFYGLLKVGINGGLATQLAAGVDGQNFSFADSVAVDQNYGDAYFVDSGAIFRTLNVTLIVQSGDTSGRLLKYEAATGQVRVLLNGLSGPAGMAMSRDRYGTFIMILEYIARKVIKYYITGPKANTTKTVLDNLEGYPDNVKRAAIKGFWVAVNIPKPQH
nr:protein STRICTOSIDINE SYNTHASE-LIKE 11-like [Ipomoea batatas]